MLKQLGLILLALFRTRTYPAGKGKEATAARDRLAHYGATGFPVGYWPDQYEADRKFLKLD